MKHGRVVGTALVALCIVLIGTWPDWWFLEGKTAECSLHEDTISRLDAFLFQHIRLPRDDQPHTRVSLITVGEQEGSDLLTNVCSGRRFMADLIDALNRQQVSVIALDKTYGASSCLDKASNYAFARAVAHSKARIVAGLPVAKVSTEGACFVKQQSFSWPAPVALGVTNVNQNSLKIPLRWPVFETEEDALQQHEPEQRNTFALAAALALDPGIVRKPIIAACLRAKAHPFSGFQSAVPALPGRDVLCTDDEGRRVASSAWHLSCAAAQRGEAAHKDSLQGRVVVIANNSDNDMHAFLGRDISGGELQARYVEALVDGDYYFEVPFWWAFRIFLLWAAGVIFVVLLRDEWRWFPRANFVVYFGVCVLLYRYLPTIRYLPPLSVMVSGLIFFLPVAVQSYAPRSPEKHAEG